MDGKNETNQMIEIIEIVKELTEMQQVYLKGVASGMATERKLATENKTA